MVLLTTKRFFSNETEYVLYFDASVNGLSVGAPVVFRGVPLGSVTRINLVADAQEGSVTIPVFISINAKNIMTSDGRGGVSEEFEQRMIQSMVDSGLRARLILQSLVTGRYAVELDFYPNTAPSYRSTEPEIEIPTIPSPIDTFQRAFSKMPIEQIVQSVNIILESLVQAFAGGKLKEGVDAFAGTFAETEKALKKKKLLETTSAALESLNETARLLRERTPESLQSFREGMQAVTEAAAQLRRAASATEDIVKPNSPAVADLRALLREGAAAARALRALADMIERNPESLLQGKKGVR
jgi:paraquat-inducible protein B